MGHSRRLGGRKVDLEILRALDCLPHRQVADAREIAIALGTTASAVAPKLNSLTKAGLARRHWAPNSTRTYAITDEGCDYLMHLDRTLRRRSGSVESGAIPPPPAPYK